jgi:hypothetical protein
MAGQRANAEQHAAAVKAPVAFSTYVGGLATLAAGIVAIVTGLIKAFGLPSQPSTAQAAVIDGAFFLSAAAVIGFAWVLIADFRSRATTHSSYLMASAPAAHAPAAHAAAQAPAAHAAAQAPPAVPQTISAPLFLVKDLQSGDVYKILSVAKDGGGAGNDLFLINREAGNKQFQWIAANAVEFVSG